VLWLGAFLLFGTAGVLHLASKPSWWVVGLAGVLVSQSLIFLAWNDAKFGTIANLLIVLALLPAYGAARFSSMVQREKTQLLTAVPSPSGTVSAQTLEPLPAPVRRWLHRAGVVGQSVPVTGRLVQTGKMKTQPGGAWISFSAEQQFRLDKPGFCWTTAIEAAPGVTLGGRDLYLDGHGHMLIKAFYLYPVADARGPETDQGTMLRYLAELCWFPAAVLNPYVRWEAIDDHSARASMTYGGTTATGVFHFTDEGDFASFDAMRYYNRKEGATLEPWHVEAKGWKTFGNGLRIPYQSEVTWKLADGDFTWLTLEITSLETP
jgi:hypothetical protein